MPNGWEFYARERIEWVGRRSLGAFLVEDYIKYGLDPSHVATNPALNRWPDPPWSKSRWLYPGDPDHAKALRRMEREEREEARALRAEFDDPYGFFDRA